MPVARDFTIILFFYAQALATRDSLAKALYGALFDWIVDQVYMVCQW